MYPLEIWQPCFFEVIVDESAVISLPGIKTSGKLHWFSTSEISPFKSAVPINRNNMFFS